jgi:bifunctional UDP-N-acetylglucosamine pyrophosphorylase/glucosamine-1-phosphate N-acetyltransferase
MIEIHAIILAAGKGTRMNSNKPKVLHTIADISLLEHALIKAKIVCSHVHVVYGHMGEMVRDSVTDKKINWIEQSEQLGTGHAVSQAVPYIIDNSVSLIMYADVPLIKVSTLNSLVELAKRSGVSLLTVDLEDPSGYGRVIRKDNLIQSIVEHKDAKQDESNITEVNTGFIAIKTNLLKKYLKTIETNNSQSELYLTDIIASAVDDGRIIESLITTDRFEVAGVNDKVQLAEIERAFQQKQAVTFMQEGLTIKDPNRFDCRGALKFGTDCIVDINVLFEGNVEIGDNSSISSNCVIKNSTIGNNVNILPNSVIENAVIGDGASVGPFSRIRPDTRIGDNAKVGNFVEVKKTTIGNNSKVSHLSYLGDATVGDGVNIGAGVISCNYDGANKHKTVIKDGAFIGSNSELIAPIVIGENSTIGAGSTITEDAPNEALTISRTKQSTYKKWRRPSKK